MIIKIYSIISLLFNKYFYINIFQILKSNFYNILISMFFYASTSSIAFLGCVLGNTLINKEYYICFKFNYHGEFYANWDGQWYKKIASVGYSYDPNAQSSVAFFPAYPLVGRAVARLTGLAPEIALVLTSNISFFLALFCLRRYIESRGPPSASVPRFADFTLLTVGLIPTSFFFRMAYSESLFLLIGISFLGAIERRRPLLVIAMIVGLATACRPVGVGLMLPFADHIWSRSSGIRNFLGKCAYLLPVACLGILEYMLYLHLEFGEPLAFAKTQVHWALRSPASLEGKVVALATLEPVRRLFDPSLKVHWSNYEPGVMPLLSLHLFDYILFVMAIVLIVLGACRRWLTRTEWLASTSLLLIPYWASAYEVDMRSMGRYTSVVIPIYLVLGRILASLPPSVAAALLASSGFLMGVYAAMFASWHMYI